MASAAENALEKNGHLLVEAGTGTGKSIAYLIPLINHSINRGKKVLIATYTKLLQSQLINKDIPLVQKIFAETESSFTYAVFFGSDNYLCLRKYEKIKNNLPTEDAMPAEFVNWAKATESGYLNDYEFKENDRLRQDVCRDYDICPGKRCYFNHNCFYYRAYKKMINSDVIIVNHHLFFTNVASGGRLLPNFDAAVLDEAHNIEEVALDLLGIQISNFQIKKLLSEIYNSKTARGAVNKLKRVQADLRAEILSAISESAAASGEFFSVISSMMPRQKDTHKFRAPPGLTPYLSKTLSSLNKLLEQTIDFADSLEDALEVKSKCRRLSAFASGIKSWLDHDLPDRVYWAERESLKRGMRITLCITPIDVAPIISEEVFNKLETVLLTSATISINGSFDYIKSALGIGDCTELCLESSFDYCRNVVLYAPYDIPNPNSESQSYEQRVKSEIKSLISASEGKAFVLFTNYKFLNSVHGELENSAEHTFFRQGSGSHYSLIERFKISENGVLFGTDSFWQGVDIPGNALLLVILTRLPFDVPDHPVVETKIDKLTKEGKDPFKEYTLPKAILKFRQGFGRLIRTKNDWGVVAVLDSRLHSKYYGKYFLNSVPKTVVTGDISVVKNFINERINKV